MSLPKAFPRLVILLWLGGVSVFADEGQPVATTRTDAAGRLLNEWFAAGKAAGLSGDVPRLLLGLPA